MADPAVEPEPSLRIDLKPGLDPREIGKVLRAARLGAGLTQAELGRRMGVVQNTIARLEAGKSPPTLATLAKFARAAGYCAHLALEPVVTEPSERGRRAAKHPSRRRSAL